MKATAVGIHKHGLCACGKPKSTTRATQCKGCYRGRGKENLPPRLGECGHPVSGIDSKQCRDCYQKGQKPEPTSRAPRDYEEALTLWRTLIGCAQQNYQGPATPRSSTTKRIALCGDFHAPFQHTEALAAFIERERGADVCIVAGDLQDHYGISRFIKYEQVPIEQELAAAQLILERLSETFPTVLLIEGNHDKPRFEKLLYDRLPLEAIDIIRFLSRTGGLSTIEALAGQFRNVELIKNKIPGTHYEVSWYLQYHDLIVSHAEKFSRVPGSALRSVEDWFSDFEGAVHLKPWRVLAQAHTHAQSLMPWRADKMMVEIGCMCKTMGYQLSAKIGGRPQRIGWTTLEQTNGVTDLSTVRPFWWEKAA